MKRHKGKSGRSSVHFKGSPVKEADSLLAEIRSVNGKMQSLEWRAQAEFEAVRARYQAIAEYGYLLGVLDKKLKKHLKEHRESIFEGFDKRGLANGTVYFGHESKVSIPKNALTVIKEHGWEEGLKITETLNRSVVEKWPADRLEAIGARLRMIDKYSYDLERIS